MQVKDRERFAALLKEFPVHKLFSVDVLPYLELHAYKKGEYICREHEPLSRLYFLAKGTVKIYVTLKNGKVNIMELISGRGIIGELEMLRSQNTTQAVQAMGEVTCFVLPLHKCGQLILEDAHFLRELCKMLSDKIIKNRDIFTVNQSYPLENRLAAYILLAGDNGVFDQRLTEVSEYIGTSYRHLLRTVAKLCERKYLKKLSVGYAITDPEGLRRLAGEID